MFYRDKGNPSEIDLDNNLTQNEKDSLNKLYTIYSDKRNVYLHSTVDPSQMRIIEKISEARDLADEILQENRFASVILPTGGGKSFVALAEMMEHQNEEMLYLAPQNEILEQMKDYIIKYVHGPVNTIRKK